MVVPIKTQCRRLLKLKDAAHYLSLSTRKVRDLVHAGELPVVRFTENSAWLIDIHDLDALIDRHKVA